MAVNEEVKAATRDANDRVRIAENQRLDSPVSLGSLDTLRVSLTAQEGRSAKRAHQVFLLLKDLETGLDVSYPFGVKENGKSKVDLVSVVIPRLSEMGYKQGGD